MKLKLNISVVEKERLLKSESSLVETINVPPMLEANSGNRKVLKRNRGYKPAFRRAS